MPSFPFISKIQYFGHDISNANTRTFTSPLLVKGILLLSKRNGTDVTLKFVIIRNSMTMKRI